MISMIEWTYEMKYTEFWSLSAVDKQEVRGAEHWRKAAAQIHPLFMEEAVDQYKVSGRSRFSGDLANLVSLKPIHRVKDSIMSQWKE